jgi:integrase/recombinase XerD
MAHPQKRWLVGYLSAIGVMPMATTPPPQSRAEELVERDRRYLVVERGLATETVVEYVRAALLFLVQHPGRALDDVGIGDVSSFMTRHSRLVSSKSVERLAAGLRSFLGFALLEFFSDRVIVDGCTAFEQCGHRRVDIPIAGFVEVLWL